MSKQCSCGNPITLKDKRNKDGLQNKCNKCVNSKRRKAYELNPTHYRERQKKYNGYALKNAKRNVEILSDFYIIAELKRGTSLTTEDIKKHPELINVKRQIIINKRKVRDEKRKRA